MRSGTTMAQSYPEVQELLLERCGVGRGVVSTKKLGNWLAELDGVPYELDGVSYRIVAVQQSTKHGNRWKLERV